MKQSIRCIATDAESGIISLLVPIKVGKHSTISQDAEDIESFKLNMNPKNAEEESVVANFPSTKHSYPNLQDKEKKNAYLCNECGYLFSSIMCLGKHTNSIHLKREDLKWRKTEDHSQDVSKIDASFK